MDFTPLACISLKGEGFNWLRLIDLIPYLCSLLNSFLTHEPHLYVCLCSDKCSDLLGIFSQTEAQIMNNLLEWGTSPFPSCFYYLLILQFANIVVIHGTHWGPWGESCSTCGCANLLQHILQEFGGWAILGSLLCLLSVQWGALFSWERPTASLSGTTDQAQH